MDRRAALTRIGESLKAGAFLAASGDLPQMPQNAQEIDFRLEDNRMVSLPEDTRGIMEIVQLPPSLAANIQSVPRSFLVVLQDRELMRWMDAKGEGFGIQLEWYKEGIRARVDSVSGVNVREFPDTGSDRVLHERVPALTFGREFTFDTIARIGNEEWFSLAVSEGRNSRNQRVMWGYYLWAAKTYNGKKLIVPVEANEPEPTAVGLIRNKSQIKKGSPGQII